MITTIRLPDELHKKIKEESAKVGMPANSLLIGILWDYFKKEASTDSFAKEEVQE